MDRIAILSANPLIMTVSLILLWAPIMWAGFWLYGRVLKFIGTKSWLVKGMVGVPIYFLFSAFLFLPTFVGTELAQMWNASFRADSTHKLFLFLCNILLFVPNLYYFKKKYLKDLQELGFFR